tara:strand:+ start:512 stop:1030 length:519 start_codon:yes stop_codon:yes gene_type:complete
MIKVYDDILPEDLCNYLIDLFEKSSQYHDSPSSNGHFYSTLNLNEHFMNVLNDIIPFTTILYLRYQSDIKTKYLPQLSNMEDFRMKRYLPNIDERFDEHVDIFDKDTCKRALVFLFYLNDSDGNTFFSNHEMNIQPKRGRVLMFPPTWEYPHAGLSPSNNSKYILSSYLHYG